jgi:beta-N-acetylhexosaminidase
MIDEEGGRVRRLPPAISPMQSIAAYGRENGAVRAAADYAAVCVKLAALGIDTLLAPVVDVRSAQNSWLADRTFSDQPQAVSDFARQVVPAIQRAGLAACAKHFPGLAGVRSDLHHHKFIVEDSTREIESRDLPPFRSAIETGVEMIMVSHAVYTAFDAARPAVFSPVIIGGILRKRLGFTGLVLSDDLAMRAVAEMGPIEKAVEQAAQSGCNLLLICNDRALQRRAVQFITRQGGEI